MPSPRGSYVGESVAELNRLLVIAKDRVANGDRTALSGGGKSGSKQWSMSAETMLFEVRYALRLATGTSAPQTTVQDFTR